MSTKFSIHHLKQNARTLPSTEFLMLDFFSEKSRRILPVNWLIVQMFRARIQHYRQKCKHSA